MHLSTKNPRPSLLAYPKGIDDPFEDGVRDLGCHGFYHNQNFLI
jgi:hypothetical protein